MPGRVLWEMLATGWRSANVLSVVGNMLSLGRWLAGVSPCRGERAALGENLGGCAEERGPGNPPRRKHKVGFAGIRLEDEEHPWQTSAVVPAGIVAVEIPDVGPEPFRDAFQGCGSALELKEIRVPLVLERKLERGIGHQDVILVVVGVRDLGAGGGQQEAGVIVVGQPGLDVQLGDEIRDAGVMFGLSFHRAEGSAEVGDAGRIAVRKWFCAPAVEGLADGGAITAGQVREGLLAEDMAVFIDVDQSLLLQRLQQLVDTALGDAAQQSGELVGGGQRPICEDIENVLLRTGQHD